MRTLSVVVILGCGVLAARPPALAGPFSEPQPQETSNAARAVAPGSDERSEPAPNTVEAIDEEFRDAIQALELRRLHRLADLAASQEGAEAASTYEAYFRRAIDAQLFAEAEAVAERVIQSGDAPPVVTWLAHVVNIFAEADRGAFRESLDSLIAAVQQADNNHDGDVVDPEVLPLAARLKLQDAYFQRLVRAGQYAIARDAFAMLRDRARDPATRSHAASRLKQLELVGQPAPPIQGRGIDGEPIDLTDFRGDVVLVVFWASWCLPNAEQAERLDEIIDAHADRGFRVLGVNVDALDEGVTSVESVLPNIRRFLIDQNVTWPNIIDTPGSESIAARYGVTDLPTSILVGRDGTVRGIILTGSAIEEEVTKALDQPRS